MRENSWNRRPVHDTKRVTMEQSCSKAGGLTGVLEALLGILLGSLTLTACGYTTRLNLPEEYSSVGVEVFANDTRLPDLERPLQDFMTRAVRDYTGSRLVRPNRASSLVRGRILSYYRRNGIRTAQNILQESGVIIEAEASLIDTATGTPLARTRSSTRVGFAFGIDGGEEGATLRALDNLAERLILDLFVIAARKAEGRLDLGLEPPETGPNSPGSRPQEAEPGDGSGIEAASSDQGIPPEDPSEQ